MTIFEAFPDLYKDLSNLAASDRIRQEAFTPESLTPDYEKSFIGKLDKSLTAHMDRQLEELRRQADAAEERAKVAEEQAAIANEQAVAAEKNAKLSKTIAILTLAYAVARDGLPLLISWLSSR